VTAGPPRLVADVGGTHARFAIVDRGGLPGGVVSLPSARFDALEPAVRAAAEQLGCLPGELADGAMAVAVAGPLVGDRIELTNSAWSFSLDATRRSLGLRSLVAMNDFEALALALPRLAGVDLEVWRPGELISDAPRALLGPGTGLGVGALVRTVDGWMAVPSEGGHRDLAPATEREWRATRRLAGPLGRLGAEDVLSGPGLAALDATLRELDDVEPASRSAEEISALARASEDAHAVEAVRMFSALLGAVAGDLALTFGARGGVYLAGGVLEGLGAAFDRDGFLSRFDGKGRMSGYVAAIPVARIVAPDAALRGAATRLETGAG